MAYLNFTGQLTFVLYSDSLIHPTSRSPSCPMLHHLYLFVHYPLDIYSRLTKPSSIIIPCTSYFMFPKYQSDSDLASSFMRGVSSRTLLLNCLSRRTFQDLRCIPNLFHQWDPTQLLTSSKKKKMRIGALLSDSLPTPTLPCHSPHAGGIIWASLCFINTQIRAKRFPARDWLMYGRSCHRFHASLRDCYYPENWDTLCCS